MLVVYLLSAYCTSQCQVSRKVKIFTKTWSHGSILCWKSMHNLKKSAAPTIATVESRKFTINRWNTNHSSESNTCWFSCAQQKIFWQDLQKHCLAKGDTLIGWLHVCSTLIVWFNDGTSTNNKYDWYRRLQLSFKIIDPVIEGKARINFHSHNKTSGRWF